MKRIIANLRLRSKMIGIVILAIGLVGIAAFVGIRYLTTSYNDFAYSAVASSLGTFSGMIDSNLKGVEDVSSSIFSHQTIQSKLEDITDLDMIQRRAVERDVTNLLNSYLSLSRHVKSLNLLLPDDGIIAYNTFAGKPPTSTLVFYEEVEHAAKAAKGEVVWLTSADSTVVVCARSIRKIDNLSLKHLGTIILHIDLDSLVRASLNAAGAGTQSRFAILTGEQVLYPKSNFSSIPWSAAKSYDVLEIDGKKEFATTKPSLYTNWNYYTLTPYEKVFHSMTVAQTVVLITLALVVLLAVVLTALLVSSVMRHFNKLFAKMDSFKSRNLVPVVVDYDYSWRQDEIGMLHRNFDEMLFEITDLIEDNFMKQILVKDAQLKALEQQVNPHFLYNTLDYLYWTARAKGQDEISQIVKSLAYLLRSTLSNDSELILLTEELQIVENYLEIQTRRFEGRLSFQSDIPNQLLHIKVPKMCIQPLVENAIHHSVEETTELCTISLVGWQTAEGVFLQVSNDHSHIEEDIIRMVREKEVTPKGHGIGLTNIHQRIGLLYGKKYGVSIENRDDWAMVTIHLPATEQTKGASP